MSTCQNCSNQYPDEFMANCYICKSCKKEQGNYEYIDSLGIGWSSEDLLNITIEEIEELIQNSKI